MKEENQNKRVRSYKTELRLNQSQLELCRKSAGVSRFVYNWGLEQKLKAREDGEKLPTYFTLNKRLNSIKREQFEWMYEVSKCCPQSALTDLDKAFANFFRRCKSNKKGKKGFPKFKSKKCSKNSFRLEGKIKITDTHIQLLKLGKLRLKENGYLPTENVKVLYATVSEKAGRWYVSVTVEEDFIQPQIDFSKPVVGVDLGIKTLAVTSEGELFENPKALRRNLKKLRRLSKSHSRKQLNSKNREKSKLKLQRLHQRISNIRSDSLHKMTSTLARESSVLVLEDLNVGGMMKNRKLSRAISDVGFYELRRQLGYKCGWYGCHLLIADRWFPSSKTCSSCGDLKSNLTLSDRVYQCVSCNLVMDRDLNAAMNLQKLGNDWKSSCLVGFECPIVSRQ